MRKDIVADVLLMLALILVVTGVAIINVPAAIIAAGVLIGAFAIWMGGR